MNFSNIDSGKAFDFGKTAEEYAKFRNIYPKELYSRLEEFNIAAPGTSLLDLGTGTGIIPKNLYKDGVKIIGADISPEQIALAKADAKKSGCNIEYITAPAESTGLPDESFDAITAAQCFFYFDREKMKKEIFRMIKPGGIFCKIFMTYTLDDKIARSSHYLVKRLNKTWTPRVSGAGNMFDTLFPGRVTESFCVDIPFTRESWHGRMCACRGTLASMDESTFCEFEKRHKKMLAKHPESFTVKHKVYISYFIIEK